MSTVFRFKGEDTEATHRLEDTQEEATGDETKSVPPGGPSATLSVDYVSAVRRPDSGM